MLPSSPVFLEMEVSIEEAMATMGTLGASCFSELTWLLTSASPSLPRMISVVDLASEENACAHN